MKMIPVILLQADRTPEKVCIKGAKEEINKSYCSSLPLSFRGNAKKIKSYARERENKSTAQ